MSSFKQFLIGASANVGPIASGMALGFSAVALPAMQGETHHPRVNGEQASWIASLVSLGMPIGSLLIGPMLDGLGRKKTLLILNFPAILGWLLQALAPTDETWFFYFVYAGRWLSGFSSVMVTATSNVYVTEIADKKLRGVLSTWTPTSVALGILLVYILGYFLPDDWRLVSYISAIFPVISIFLILSVLPESPTWLASRGRIHEADASLRLIRGVDHSADLPDTLQEELDSMIARNSRQNKTRTWRDTVAILKRPEAYKPILIFTAYYFFQTFSGMFVIIFYTVNIVQEMKGGVDGYLATILVGGARFVGSIIVSVALRWCGRRRMNNISGVGMCASLVALTVFLSLEDGKIYSWLPASMLVLYILTCTLGFLTLPFSMVSEVLPDSIRATASGILIFIWCLLLFSAAKLYPDMNESWGLRNVFAFYSSVAVVGTIVMYFYLPETQNKTLEEVAEHFRGGQEKRDVIEHKKVNYETVAASDSV